MMQRRQPCDATSREYVKLAAYVVANMFTIAANAKWQDTHDRSSARVHTIGLAVPNSGAGRIKASPRCANFPIDTLRRHDGLGRGSIVCSRQSSSLNFITIHNYGIAIAKEQLCGVLDHHKHAMC